MMVKFKDPISAQACVIVSFITFCSNHALSAKLLENGW